VADNDENKATETKSERRWRLIETWTVPAILALFAVQALWYLAVQPALARIENARERALEPSSWEPDYREPSVGYVAPRDYEDDELDRVLEKLREAHAQRAEHDDAPAQAEAQEPASLQLAARLITLAVLLTPEDSDAAVSKMDEAPVGNFGPTAIRIEREDRRWRLTDAFRASEYVPGADARIAASVESADAPCTRAIIAANREAYLNAAAAIEEQAHAEPAPDWANELDIDGSGRHVKLRPAFTALFLDGGLREPRPEDGAPDWCRSPN